MIPTTFDVIIRHTIPWSSVGWKETLPLELGPPSNLDASYRTTGLGISLHERAIDSAATNTIQLSDINSPAPVGPSVLVKGDMKSVMVAMLVNIMMTSRLNFQEQEACNKCPYQVKKYPIIVGFVWRIIVFLTVLFFVGHAPRIFKRKFGSGVFVIRDSHERTLHNTTTKLSL